MGSCLLIFGVPATAIAAGTLIFLGKSNHKPRFAGLLDADWDVMQRRMWPHRELTLSRPAWSEYACTLLSGSASP